jgi:hypothetical protein
MNPEKQRKTNIIVGKSIRYLLFGGLLYGVYTETGFWTTALLTLIIVENEFKTYLFGSLTDSVQWLASVVVQLVKKYQEGTHENNKED